MKKYTAVILALALAVLSVFMLSACGNDDKIIKADPDTIAFNIDEGISKLFEFSDFRIESITESSVSSDEPDFDASGMNDKLFVECSFKNRNTDDFIVKYIYSGNMFGSLGVGSSSADEDSNNTLMIFTNSGYYLSVEPYEKYGFYELSSEDSKSMAELMSIDFDSLFEDEVDSGLFEYAKVIEHKDGSITVECNLKKDEVMKVCKTGVEQTLDYLDLSDGEVSDTSALYIFDLTKDGTISRVKIKSSVKVLYNVGGKTYHCDYNDSIILTVTDVGGDIKIDIPDENKTMPMDEYYKELYGIVYGG